MYEMSRQSRFDARYWMLRAGALGRPRGMVWGGRREEGSGWGTHVYLWWIHFNIWQNQYNIVKFKDKIKKNKYANGKKKRRRIDDDFKEEAMLDLVCGQRLCRLLEKLQDGKPTDFMVPLFSSQFPLVDVSWLFSLENRLHISIH